MTRGARAAIMATFPTRRTTMTDDRPHPDDETTTPAQGDELLGATRHEEVTGRAAERPHVDDEETTPPHGDELLAP
jgi:hypothetical protein